jgi:hypothetical protein
MARKVIIGAANHIRFTPLDEVLPPKYNTIQFDKAMFAEQIRSWQTKVEYGQKIQHVDALSIQIWTSQSHTAILKVYNCSGELITSSGFNLPSGMPLIERENTFYTVQQYISSTFFNSLASGVYFLVIDVGFDTSGDNVVDIHDLWVSEPLIIKESHPETLLIEYAHSENKDNIIFVQTLQSFALRIDGVLTDMQFKATRTVFVDQGENSKQLSAFCYRTWKLMCGTNQSQVPDYLIDKLNHILTFDSVYIEGKGYTLLESSNIEKTSEKAYPLYMATVELGEKDNNEAYEYSRGGITILANIPDYPFPIYQTRIGKPENIRYTFNPHVRIGSSFNLDSWIAARNSELAAAGLQGTIVKDGNSIVYLNALMEDYTFASCKVLEHRLVVNCTIDSPVNIPLEIRLAGGLNAAPYAVYAPGFNLASFGDAPGTPQTIINTGTNGTVAGIYAFEIFHTGEITQLYLLGSYISGIVQNTDRSLPRALEFFGIDNSIKLTTFNIWDNLRIVRPTLRGIRLYNNANLTSFGKFYEFVLGGDNIGWQKIIGIVLQNNKFSSSEVDRFFNQMYGAFLQGQFYLTGGFVWTNGQAPPAPPTSASSMARATLASPLGWSMLID